MEYSKLATSTSEQDYTRMDNHMPANTSLEAATMSPPPFQLKASSENGMDDNTLQRMSNAFDTDFSDVKIHQNSESATQASALAYTQGNDIHFSPGQYDPESSSGRELIGHELTHVVQQREGRVQANNEINGMPLNNDPGLEQEADIKGAEVSK